MFPDCPLSHPPAVPSTCTWRDGGRMKELPPPPREKPSLLDWGRWLKGYALARQAKRPEFGSLELMELPGGQGSHSNSSPRRRQELPAHAGLQKTATYQCALGLIESPCFSEQGGRVMESTSGSHRQHLCTLKNKNKQPTCIHRNSGEHISRPETSAPD